MPSAEEAITRLRKLAEEQLELLRLALYLMSEGSVQRDGALLTCNLASPKKRAAAATAMAAGQSLNTILKASDSRGIPVRDLYPIARSSIEAFVNASYLVAAEDDVSERALRYVDYAAWKYSNRTVGSGAFTLSIQSDPDPEASSKRFPDFVGKGNGSWTKLDVPSRIRHVGESGSNKAGSRLLAAYALVYTVSSEVIHGSTYGVSYFFQAHLRGEPSVEAFREATAQQLIDILVAVLHGAAGFLATFFNLQRMEEPGTAEQELFDRLVGISTADTAGESAATNIH